MTLLRLGIIGWIVLTPLAVQAQSCPAAGARYVIKGFTGDTQVVAAGAPFDKKKGCKWNFDEKGVIWWFMGADVLPSGGAGAPAVGAASVASKHDAALQPGRVYTCTLPGIGLFTGAFFGIVDSNTYRNFDRKTGRYSFDASTGVLRMTSGSSKGLAYKLMPQGNFRVLDEKDSITGGNCVHAAAKRIDGNW
jgi:hypothetical protein